MESNLIDELPKDKLLEFMDALPEFSQYSVVDVEGEYKHGESNIREFNPPVLVGDSEVEQLDSDFGIIRQNLANLTERSTAIIDDLLALAKATDSPRAYEVLVSTITALGAANKDLLEVHEKRAKIKKSLKESVSNSDEPRTGGDTTNIQNNFAMSTVDVMAMIRANPGGHMSLNK